MKRLTMLVVLMTILLYAAVAHAHPADGYETAELPAAYGTDSYGLGPECNVNELYFIRPLPDPATLSSAERYILAGLTGAAPPALRQSYMTIVATLAGIHYENTGTLPSRLSAEVLATVSAGPEDVSAGWQEQMKSPISGEYPRLDAAEFSPGDFYIRPLTETEMQHIAAASPNLARLWFDGVLRDPGTAEDLQLKLVGPVYYVRVYGEDDVIATWLDFTLLPR